MFEENNTLSKGGGTACSSDTVDTVFYSLPGLKDH